MSGAGDSGSADRGAARRDGLLAGHDAESKAVAEALERQLDVQARVAELSRRFLALDGEEIDAGVREHLCAAAELAGADRTRLIVMHPDASERPIGVYDWSAPGVSPDMPVIPDAVGRFDWSIQRLARGELIQLGSPDELPAEARAEREDMTARGVRSLLVLPVRSGDAVIGFHVFECLERQRTWAEYEITTLHLVGEIFAGTVRRRHMRDALGESETRFRAIADHATELVAELDARGCYRYASPSFEGRLGYDPEELLQRRVREFMHPDDYDALHSVYAEALANASEVRAVHRLRHRDGSWRWFESSGRAHRMASGEVRFCAIGRDITERRAVEDAIERQLDLEKRIAGLSRRFLALRTEEIDPAILEALVEAAALAGADRCFLYSQGPDGNQRSASYEWCGEDIASAAEACHPWSEHALRAGEILNVPSLDAFPPEAEQERESLRERRVQSLLSIPIRSGDRTIGVFGFETIHAEHTWSDHDVTLLRLIGEILTSALGRKHAEVALRDSESRILQMQKLEAVGRLAGGIAHDFNNLLTVILGFSRPLLRELAEDDPIREDLQEIHGAAERAASLTRQLLTFSRRQVVDEQVMDLSAMISGLKTLLERLLGEDVEFALDLEPALQGVKGDTHQFEQVVINLAANARDAMPEGGVLKITTRNAALDTAQAQRNGLPGAGRYVLLSVSDSGHGMDEETRAQIFDPFFTTKEPGKGTGLGLSIAYSVVEQVGGAIRVEGGPSKGTTFELWLPTAEEEMTDEFFEDGGVEEPGSGCVLLVEDESSLRRLARRILENGGYRVIEAADGAEALEVAAACAERIDALVTDVVMPRLGGVELARRLGGERPEMRLLFMSGYPDDRGCGASGLPEDAAVIEKPFRANRLLASLREVLEEASDGGA
jgi:two-component system cell cycle sensor histidine kinase/response regulator CckA